MGVVDSATMTNSGVSLSDNTTGTDICQSVASKEYGVIECHTINDTIPSGSLISVLFKPY
jgi:hypothetical protein